MIEGGGQPFKAGEIVGEGESSGTAHAVVIQIVRAGLDEIEAEVIELGEFYSAARLGHKGFVHGEKLFFEKSNNFDSSRWIIRYPLGRSWMILSVGGDGSKRFEHYR